MRLHKIHGLLKDSSLYSRVVSAEAVTAPRHAQEFVVYPELGQLSVHFYGFFEGHVRVRCPMNQYDGRVLRRNVANRTVSVKPLGFSTGIMARHFIRPGPLLAAI